MPKKREDPFDPKFAINQPRAGESQSIDSGGAIAASPAEEIESEAPASQGEALTAAQEKALAALQKCLVAIQNKLRAAYADAKRDSDPRVAEMLRTVVESLKEKRLDEVLLNGMLTIPTDYSKHPPVIGMELKFGGVTEAWAEVVSTVQADAKSLYPDISDRKFKKLVQRNTSAYKQLLGSAVQNTFASPQTPDLVAVARNARAQRAEGPANPEQVDKATGAAAGINEDRQGKAKRTWMEFLDAAAFSFIISTIIITALTAAGIVAAPLASLSLAAFMSFIGGPMIRAFTERLFGRIPVPDALRPYVSAVFSTVVGVLFGQYVFYDVLSSLSLSDLTGGIGGETTASTTETTTDIPTPEQQAILDDPRFQPGQQFNVVERTLNSWEVQSDGSLKLIPYDASLTTKVQPEEALRYMTTAGHFPIPPAPTIIQERIPMEMPPRADGVVATPEASAGTSEAPTQPAPAEPPAAQPTTTGGETVAPPAETAPIFAGGNEGMVSILERLREQVLQAAAQGATFPEGSLADQLLKAESQADLIKIAQDYGWFSTAADTAGTPDSVVIHENDQFSINEKGDMVAPKDFASRGMTDTGDYTPKGTVQRS